MRRYTPWPFSYDPWWRASRAWSCMHILESNRSARPLALSHIRTERIREEGRIEEANTSSPTLILVLTVATVSRKKDKTGQGHLCGQGSWS